MSDLSATQCGCNNTREGNNGCCSLIWLIILLSVCGNNNDGCGCGNGISLFNNNGDGCGSWIWILILLSCCGNSFC
ncbi:MAG: chorion class high-cysteine HCB protein 13 [Roseburia sp.]|nr:chorion class high-cysteine HCB protein 13 [Ruminococcus sp.]MCM1155886.1 chorion class high-cysteine HCB protein 13 [Roseburia sp.]MCM1243055.1 chorion class high-cysteine HCB protein 13 [Roseburia sp.]